MRDELGDLRAVNPYDPPLGVHCERPTLTRYVVVFWLSVAATLAYIQRNSISVAEKSIRTELGLSPQQMGWVMSAFFLTYAAMQVPGGWLGHVHGTRRTLSSLAALWSLATGAMALATGATGLIVTRALNGAAQAGLFPCCTRTVADWFPRTGRALPNGALTSAMSAGGALGVAFTGVILQYEILSWQLLYALYAVPGFLWAAFFFFWFRDQPQDHRGVNAAELELIRAGVAPRVGADSIAQREPTPWGTILTSPGMLWICAQHFFRGAGYIFYASWFSTFLIETRGVSMAEAGTLNSLPLVAVVIASPLAGKLSDWILASTGSLTHARKSLSIASLVLSAMLLAAAYWIQDAGASVLVISAGAFCAGFSGPMAYTITIDMGGRHVATVFSLMNMAGNLGAMVSPVLVPWFVKWSGNWQAVLLMFAGIHALAAVSWFLLDPNHSIVGNEDTGNPNG